MQAPARGVHTPSRGGGLQGFLADAWLWTHPVSWTAIELGRDGRDTCRDGRDVCRDGRDACRDGENTSTVTSMSQNKEPRRTTTQLNRDPDGQRLNSTVTWTENTSTVTSMSQNKEPRRTTTQLNCDPGGQLLNSTVTQADSNSTQPADKAFIRLYKSLLINYTGL